MEVTFNTGFTVYSSVLLILCLAEMIHNIFKVFLYITVTPYYKNKLRGLYNTAMQDAESEAE